ncbi:MotE family protein [Actibacterium sp. 188UL27-1]|uniref:MotE family protein n=1 Tax=Actibacterium sp. 188UL27-1 TaxID=2786961 RepID=UPI001EF40B80|nr:hypothetical protein [Actibacterium sp. 188UL27-1]
MSETAGVAIAKGIPTAEKAESMPKNETGRGVSELLARLLEREKQVTRREEALRSREVTLNRIQKEVTANLRALEEAETRLEETMAVAGTAAESDLDRLTRVYENMKPKDAVALFQEMTPTFAAGFLGRMKPDAAAAVMSGLRPETAYSVSLILSGRNLNAPTD